MDNNINVNIICFTDKGEATARRIVEGLGAMGQSASYYRCEDGKLKEWTEQAFSSSQSIIYVGAVGIAVRAIAPFINSKLTDPAVIVVDELGKYIIPVLSGHIGGANQIALNIKSILGASSEAVITTATDVEKKFAIDVWAMEHGLKIYDKSGIKYIAGKLLRGEEVSMGSDVVITNRCDEEATLKLISPVTIGIGCRKGATKEQINSLLDKVLEENGIIKSAISCIASIDIKANEAGIIAVANKLEVPFVTFSAKELEKVPGEYSESQFVMDNVGVGSVCARSAMAACLDRYDSAELLMDKVAMDGVTVAIAQPDMNRMRQKLQEKLVCCKKAEVGWLKVVGMGAGSYDGMTIAAIKAIEQSDCVVGYSKYIELIREIFPAKETYATGMMQEVDRCRAALDMCCNGKNISVVCSGDASVYGMAGLVLELAGLNTEYRDINIQVIPGVTAALSGGAILGAPLGHDFAVISLSDLLTPWEKIEERIEAAAQSDMCIALYNPSSKKRKDYLRKACDIMLQHKSGNTVCGIAINIGREGEECRVLTLSQLVNTEVDMFSTVFIGNSNTKNYGGHMVTPRGYKI